VKLFGSLGQLTTAGQSSRKTADATNSLTRWLPVIQLLLLSATLLVNAVTSLQTRLEATILVESRKIICKFRIFLFSVLISAVNQPPILNTGKGNNLYAYFAELIYNFCPDIILMKLAFLVNVPH